MKRIYTLFAFAAIAAAFASCNKNEYAATSGNTLSITVGTEAKTILRGEKVHWVKDDQICIFDTENAGFIFKTAQSDVPSATFTCENWTGTTPVFAVHSNGNNITKNIYDGSIVTSYLNPTQSIANKNSYAKEASLSVGKVSDNGGSYSVEAMKNCFAIIGFTLKDPNITSVTLSGNNGENLAGWVDVDYQYLDSTEQPFWTVNTAKGGAQIITVKPTGSASSDGKFISGTTKYYISVLPQTLSKGMTLVMARADGMSATREIQSSVELKRSVIKNFKNALDSALVFKKGDIVLDCTDANKFFYNNGDEDVKLPVANNSTSKHGENFTTCEFWLNGYKDYKFQGSVKIWSNTLNAKNSYIKLPLISEYKLKEVNVTYSHPTADRTYSITDGPSSDANTLGSCKRKQATTTETKIDLTNPLVTPKSNERYLYCPAEMGVKFILTYEYVPQE